MISSGVYKHKNSLSPQENPISLQNSPIKMQNKQSNHVRDSKSVNTSIEAKKKEVSQNIKKQSKQALNKILYNPSSDDKNLGVYHNNHSRNQLEEVILQQQNYYSNFQPQQQQYGNQIQNNASSLISRKQENQNLNTHANHNESNNIYQTPPRTKILNYSNWEPNLDNTLPYIHQNFNHQSQKHQQLLQLQTTQKKQQNSHNRTNSQKTKKKEDILAPYIYGNNPFKNPQQGATLSGGFRYQPPPFVSTIKKQVKKSNNSQNQYNSNPSLSENEADDDVNVTYHHPSRNRNNLDNPLSQPQNILDQIFQPQNQNSSNAMKTNQEKTNNIVKTRASASFNSDPSRDITALTDSEANDQTSQSRYNRKKYTVKRRAKEEEQSKQLQGFSSNNRSVSNNYYHNKQENVDNKKDQPGATLRNNWSQYENSQKQESNDKQYLTQYSNTMNQQQFQGQHNILSEDSRQHSTSVKGGINPYLRVSHQSYDSIANQILSLAPKSSHSTNAKLIENFYNKGDNSYVAKQTEISDTSLPQIQFVNNTQTDQQKQYGDSLSQQYDRSILNTFNIDKTIKQNSQMQTQEKSEDDGKALSSVPSKPSYEYNINEIGSDKNGRRVGEYLPITSQINDKKSRRKERSNSYRMQHLEQKESQIINMAYRENEFGNKMQTKKSQVATFHDGNQLLPHQNIILNSRMNEIKKQIQVKDIQRLDINIDLIDKQKENKIAIKQQANGQTNHPQSQLSNHINTHQSRRTKKTSSALENGIYLYNNDFEFEEEEETGTYPKQQSSVEVQKLSEYHNNSNNNQNQVMKSQQKENTHNATSLLAKDNRENELVNNSDISTNISSPNPSILNEINDRKNNQHANEPHVRHKLAEKSHSVMPHSQKVENTLADESFLTNKDCHHSKHDQKNSNNSLSPDSFLKNESMMIKQKLAKACIRFSVLGGGEVIEAEDFSLKSLDSNGQSFNKYRINIKNVVEIEDYMEQICQHLSNQSYEYMNSAEQFIIMINEDPQYNINQVYRFFSDEKLSRVGKVLTVLELISVYLIIKIGRTKKTSIRQYYPKMKSLLTYIHQSFLLFWDQIYLLFSQNIEDKDCLERLRERIEEKRQVKLGNKKSSYLQLKQNYDIICSLIKPLIKEIKEISQDLAKLFKVFEDQTIVETFNTVKQIFGVDLIQNESGLKEQENEQSKQTSVGKPINPTNKRARNIKPFLPQQDTSQKALTLVLDLDETLIHFYETRNGGQYQKRPFCDKFLREMSKLYELVIFTAGTEDYANWVLDSLDKNKFISYRLYRQHTNFTNCVYVKDLSKIGRDLSKTIIVDNVPENFRLQRENGIGIKSWYNDRNDTALNDIIPVLTELAQQNPEDVRIALKKLRQKYPPHKVRGNFDLPY
ncbi:hypothetical protein ABPG74_014780 [Tetrahymena malaccensis]